MERKPINKYAPMVCTAQEMRSLDRYAIEKTGISGIVLMENAALSCVRFLEERFDLENTSFAVFCGKGNNGGDGFAVARHLFNKGAEVYVYLTNGSEFEGDALQNYRILRALGVTIIEIDGGEFLESFVKSADCVVDAILGTGISGAPRGFAQDAIDAINKFSKFTLSVDVPSGINSDSGDVRGLAVKADATVTFAAYKRGTFLYPAAEYFGEVVLADISIPKMAESMCTGCYAADMRSVSESFPKRRDNSHKGDYGRIMIIGGSVGMAGAVAMSAKAALRCGAGLITVAVPESINDIIQGKIDEVMTLPLPEENGAVTFGSARMIAERANICDAVLIGPGLGRGEGAVRFVNDLLPLLTVPTVIDADGIYAVSKDRDILKRCECELIITPHAKEMEYLTAIPSEDIEQKRFEVSGEFTSQNRVTLILKGHHSIITAPDSDMTVNTSGNSGMAGAGSGDVLSGMAVALLARGLDAYTAAVSATYLHGRAGDFAAEKFGKDAMCAGDIIDAISHILPVEN